MSILLGAHTIFLFFHVKEEASSNFKMEGILPACCANILLCHPDDKEELSYYWICLGWLLDPDFFMFQRAPKQIGYHILLDMEFCGITLGKFFIFAQSVFFMYTSIFGVMEWSCLLVTLAN